MPHPMLFILAIIDIFSGVLTYFHPGFLVRPYLYLAILCFIKGGWSFIAAVGSHFYFDILGFIDIIVGICLLLMYYNVTFPFSSTIGIIMILKGIWSLFFSITTG
jgi:hypothetical protein